MISKACTAILAIVVLTKPALALCQSAEYTLVTDDLSRFYSAVDAGGSDSVALAQAFRKQYLDRGSPGLREFALIRLARNTAMGAVQKLGWDENRAMASIDAAPASADRRVFDSAVAEPAFNAAAKALARTYLARRAYYDAIRPNLIAVDTARQVKSAITTAFRRMRALYPAATYPKVYFLVGRLSTGGTTFGENLLIGTEIYGRDSSTPTGQLSDWERSVTGQAKDLASIVAHEYVHTLQGHSGPQTLLSQSLLEGGADFVAELIAGAHIINPAYEYGDAHADDLWAEFKGSMDSSDFSKWLYNASTIKDRPADLGYWAGYRIVKAYYDKSTDKRAAISDIIALKNPSALLHASGL